MCDVFGVSIWRVCGMVWCVWCVSGLCVVFACCVVRRMCGCVRRVWHVLSVGVWCVRRVGFAWCVWCVCVRGVVCVVCV